MQKSNWTPQNPLKRLCGLRPNVYGYRSTTCERLANLPIIYHLRYFRGWALKGEKGGKWLDISFICIIF